MTVLKDQYVYENNINLQRLFVKSNLDADLYKIYNY